jgi:hypothetical protein
MTDRIPGDELATLKMTCAEAEDLAAGGEAADGYTALLAGAGRWRTDHFPPD